MAKAVEFVPLFQVCVFKVCCMVDILSLVVMLEQDLCSLYSAAREQLSSTIKMIAMCPVSFMEHTSACDKLTYSYQERDAWG